MQYAVHTKSPDARAPTQELQVPKRCLVIPGQGRGFPKCRCEGAQGPKMVPKTAKASPLWSQDGVWALRGPKMVPEIAKASSLWSQNGARVRGQCAEGCPNVAASALRGPKMVPESAKARARARDVD